MRKGGVIGFGRMGVTHYAILNTHPEVELVAVCDSSGFVMKNLSRVAPVKVFTNYKQMLDDVAMDFVVIATPTASHVELVEASIARGLHMFVEKPFALSAEAGRKLVALLDHNRLVNQVGYFLRWNEAFEMVRHCLDEGLIGEPVHYRNEMYGRTVLHPSKSSWRSKKKHGGGCMLDFASHCIDLSDYFFGPPRRVGGSVLKRVYSRSVEDAVYTTLFYENGLSGNIMVNWSDESYRRPYNRIEIFGTKGKLIADRQECRIYLRKPDDAGRFPSGWTIKYLPQLARTVRFDIRGTEFTNQLDHFVDCMLKRTTESLCSFADGLRTDCVIEQIEADWSGP